MGGYGDVQCIDENGIRLDGRTKDEVRPVSIETGVVPVADGSARIRWGLNDCIAAVYGPMEAHPRKIQRQDRAVLDVRYNMAPFSTTDRIRPGFNRRSREISKVTAEALESVVLTELYPRSKISCRNRNYLRRSRNKVCRNHCSISRSCSCRYTNDRHGSVGCKW